MSGNNRMVYNLLFFSSKKKGIIELRELNEF